MQMLMRTLSLMLHEAEVSLNSSGERLEPGGQSGHLTWPAQLGNYPIKKMSSNIPLKIVINIVAVAEGTS
jgi:hypothetical protein